MKKESSETLQKKITEYAIKKFNKELSEFIKLANKSNIISQIRIKPLGEQKEAYPIFIEGYYSALINDTQHDSRFIGGTTTNFNEIKEKIIAQYEKEYTDEILSKIEQIGDIYNDLNDLKNNQHF